MSLLRCVPREDPPRQSREDRSLFVLVDLRRGRLGAVDPEAGYEATLSADAIYNTTRYGDPGPEDGGNCFPDWSDLPNSARQ